MGTPWRDRVAFWLERQPWAREFVLREDASTAEWVEDYVTFRVQHPAHQMLRVQAINRINGHTVLIQRRPNARKRDGYVAAAMIGAVLGALVQYGIGSLIESLT